MDLKKATRITAEDLEIGDRVQVFASGTEDNSDALAARSVILMSARDLESVHHEQAAAWQHSTPGLVISVDSAAGKLAISVRGPAGPKPVMVDVAKAQFTRYSLTNPTTPASSNLGDIQAGDQVRILGDMNGDGSVLTARSVYSSPVRMLLCTVTAVSPDGKQITAQDLQRKQSVIVALTDNSAIRKLPPPLAYGFARRLNPDFKPAGGAGPDGIAPGTAPASAAPDSGKPAGAFSTTVGARGPNGAGGARGAFEPGGGPGRGDLSQMLDRLPKISATDLKPGDAVVIAGVPATNDNSRMGAISVIAGVEPIFRSASPRQMQSLGDWGTSLGGGLDGGTSPQ